MPHTHKVWKTFFRGAFTHCFPLGVWHRSEDFQQLHLWLVRELSTVPSLTQVVLCYLACGWYFPQPFTLGLHFSHSLALSACVPLRGLIGRLSHRETGRDISHAELIACGGIGGVVGLMKCKADAGFFASIWGMAVRGPDVFAPCLTLVI